MPWSTPTLDEVRKLNRDNIAAYLLGADASVPNSAVRVLSEQNAGGAHLNLLYLDYIATNLLPDQSETEWLDRWANIYFGGRKAATFAAGLVAATGTVGAVLPTGTLIGTSDGVSYQTTADIYLSAAATPVPVECLTPGSIGNRDAGAPLTLSVAVSGIDAEAVAIGLTGGADRESDDDLRNRVLLRIRETPMGGDRDDYVQWALDVPGVTRAWVAPLEMGIGTVTVRFMCDDLRASNNGFPLPEDEEAVRDYLDTVRPVAIKDFWAFGPIPHPFSIAITALSVDSPSTRTAIAKAVDDMLHERAKPGQTIYATWLSEAISGALGEDYHDADYANVVMPTKGHIGVLSSITYPLMAEPDRHVRRGGEDYAEAFACLLPTGPAWPRDPDSALMRYVRAQAEIWGAKVDPRAADLLEIESDPRSTLELLPEWERAFGLPDPCVSEPLTIEARRTALINKITAQGGQSRAFFIGVALRLGYTITIREFSPFMAGLSQAGDTRSLDDGTHYRWECGPPEIRFYWVVKVGLTRLSWFRAGSGQAGLDPHCRIGRATDLECVFGRWAPAHTQVIFDYSALPPLS